MLKYFGLGEPFGKASSANTALGLGRFVPMRERSPWILEGWLRHPSEAWPYEVLERGLPRLLPKRMKNWGWARKLNLTLRLHPNRILQIRGKVVLGVNFLKENEDATQ